MERNLAPGLGSGEAPVLVRLGGKLVLEVLPAALASAIGAFLSPSINSIVAHPLRTP